MKLFRSIFGAFAVCLFPVICFGYGVTVVGPTSPVEVGQQYTITAGLQVRNQSEIPQSITITRDGQTLAQSVSSTQYTCPGESTGGQTVTYSVRGVYRNGTVVGQNYSVTVNAPPSHPPTVEWQTTQTHGVFGEQINIIAIGHDVDGDLSGVHIWRDGQPFAFELNQLPDGTPRNYGAFAGRLDPMPSEIRQVHYYVQAEDLGGNKSEWVDLYIDVKSANAPVRDDFHLSIPYIYQTTDIIVSGHDPDGDFKNIAIEAQADEVLSPDSPFPGQYQMSFTAHNHHNPGPNKSYLAAWVHLRDWSGNEYIRYLGEEIVTDNRAPTAPTFTASTTTVVIGTPVTLATAGHDNDGNMTVQNFIIKKKIGPGPDDYGEPIPVTGFTSANGVYDNTLTTSWTPTEEGTYRIFGRANDPYDYADSSYIIVVASLPPDTTPPEPATNFVAGTPIAATIPLTWTKSASGDLDHYILTWGPVGGAQSDIRLSFDEVGYVTSLLSPGVTYQFVMRSYDHAGNISAPTPTITATAAKLSQSITFLNPGNQTYNTPFPQTAYSSSGLAISYSISGPVLVEGANFRANGVGQVTITAKQAGNSVYSPAQDVAQTFTVNRASQTLLFYNPGTHAYGDPAFDLGATVNSGLPISYSVTGPATRVGSMLTVTGAGTVSVTASQAGNENYLPVSITQTFTVNRASQTITFAGPSERTYGDAPFDLVASASSNLPVNFSVVSGLASVSGARLTILGAGTVTVRASQGGDADHYFPAANVDRTFNIKKANQTITFNNPGSQVAGSSLALTASASSGLMVAFAVESGPATVTGSTLSLNGTGTVKVVASQAGDTNYNPATSIPQSFLVSAATQPDISILPTTSTVARGASITFTASGGGFGGYTWGGTAGATGNGAGTTKTVTFNSSGTFTVTVSSPGDAAHGPSNTATATITVNQSTSSTVSISPDAATVAKGGSVNFTASGGGAGGYTWGGTSGASGIGATNTVTFPNEGTFTVTVMSPGDANTGPSNTATATVTVGATLPPPGLSLMHPTVAARLAIMAKGVGKVRMTINGQTVEYLFNRTDGKFGEPTAVASGFGLDAVGPYIVSDDINYPVAVTSQGVTDYVISPSIDPTADPMAQRRIYINDRFLDSTTKSEIEGRSGQFYFKSVRTASLPFGIVDLSKFETARMIYFGLGTNTAGLPAGMATLDLSSYMYDLTRFTVEPPRIGLNAGPGLLEAAEIASAFQARSSNGIIDVQRSSTAITIRFFNNGDYTKTNGFYDFGTASPLIEYDIALSQPTDTYTTFDENEVWRLATQFSLTRKVGTDQRVFEARTDYFAYDGAEHPEGPESPNRRWLRNYDATVRIWPWRKPDAPHQNLLQIDYHSHQDMVRIPGQQVVPQDLIGIQLIKRSFSGADKTSTVLHFEKARYNANDRWLLSGVAEDTAGAGTADFHYIRSEAPYELNSIKGRISGAEGGPTRFTEFYHSWNPIEGSNLGTQPISATGKPKTVRTTFLDGNVGGATDLITTNTYTLVLNNTKTLLETSETVQGTTKIGKSSYSYATSTLNSMEVLETTEDDFVNSGESLRTVTKTYSGRAADRDFSDKPVSILHSDQTKVSYAYQRGDLSGSTWTASSSGRYLLVAELSGKSGTGVTKYREVNLDPLDMEASKSTVSERIVDPFGHVIRESSYVYTADGTFSVLASTYYGYDDFGNLIAKSDQSIGGGGRVLYQANFTGFRKNWEVDEQGIKLTYSYDNYERVSTVTREAAGSIASVTTANAYDEMGRLKSETVSSASTTETFVTSYTYDTASRVKTKTVPGGLVTSTTYNSPTLNTVVLPGGGQQVTEIYKDGRPKSITGTAVAQTSSSYSYDSSGFLKSEVTLTSTNKKTTSYSDWAGRAVKTETTTWGGSTRTASNTYNSSGQLVAQDVMVGTTKLTPTHLFEYDSYGRLVREGVHVGTGTSIDLSSDIGVSDHNAFYEKKQLKRIDDNSNVTSQPEWYLHETSKVYPYGGANASKAKLASESFTQISGLSDSLAAHTLSADADRNWTQSFVSVTPSTKTRVTTSLTTGCAQAVTSTYTNGLLTRATNAQGHVTLQTYDALGRLEGVDDPRIGLTSYAYIAGGPLVKSITAPDLKTATYEYDDAGRKSAQYNAVGKVARYQYDVKGNLTHTWGETVNPVKFVYNDLGQKTEMHTYRTGTWTGATLPADFTGNGDTTTWNYQASTGLLTSKVDAAGGTTSYQYDNLDRTTKRTDARGWITNYAYFAATHASGGKLDTISYVDGSGAPTPTPSVSYTYHRSGAIKTVSDAAGTRSFDYYETWTSDDNDSDLRNKSGHLKSEYIPGFFSLAYDYQYAVTGRRNGEISSLQFGNAYTVNYGYDANLRLSTVSYNSVTPFTYTYVTNSNLIDTVAQITGSSTFDYRKHFNYESNSNRISGMVQDWGTNANTQLTSIISYNGLGLKDSEKIKGQDWAYWQRTSIGLQSTYAYTDRYEVNSSVLYQVNSDWTTGSPNGRGARNYSYDPIGNRIQDQFGSYTPNGLNQYDYSPSTTEKFTYDANGNLTFDGFNTYYYDGENRLIKFTSTQPGTSYYEYAYDYLGRRISKSVNGTVAAKFVYDGWNLIVELDGSSGVVCKHVWGLDASGSLQGAGGAGGLLLCDSGGAAQYPFYDASYNVISLVNQSGSTIGAWQYDAFGQMITRYGGGACPFRHATKFLDSETSFYYYGMRYYNQRLGRFINRDPSGESGGTNLYGFCGNDPVNAHDLLGLSSIFDDLWNGGGAGGANAIFNYMNEDTKRYTVDGDTYYVKTAGSTGSVPTGAQLVGGSFADGRTWVNSAAFQPRNTGGYSPSEPFGNTKITYDNYGDSTEGDGSLSDDFNLSNTAVGEADDEITPGFHLSNFWPNVRASGRSLLSAIHAVDSGIRELLSLPLGPELSDATMNALVIAPIPLGKTRALAMAERTVIAAERTVTAEKIAAKFVTMGEKAGTFGAKDLGRAIAQDPLASKLYARVQAAGFHVRIVFGEAGNVAGSTLRDGFIDIYMSNNATLREALATFAHETSHVDRLMLTSNFGGRFGEYMARAREFYFRYRVRPNAAQRRFINQTIDKFYEFE